MISKRSFIQVAGVLVASAWLCTAVGCMSGTLSANVIPESDGGTSLSDTGVIGDRDASERADAGEGESDAFVPEQDAFVPGEDAGMIDVDAGMTMTDAGRPDGGRRDSGMADIDMGSGMDMGAPIDMGRDMGGAIDMGAGVDMGPRFDGGVAPPTVYEGFGAGAVTAAMSTTTCHVTNFNTSGSGSMSNCLGSNRTIVFDVGGTFYSARYDISNVSNLFIDGFSAPSPGVTFDNKTMSGGSGFGGDVFSFIGTNTHHVVLRGVRTINAGNDGINVVDGAHDIVIANCTSYNNADGAIDIASGHHVTVQYCLMGPSSERGPGPMLITAREVTVHHNFFMPAAPDTPGERCPMIHANYSPVGAPNADVVNNLVWRFGRDNGEGSGYGIDVAYNATANAENNYVYTEGSSPTQGVANGAYGEPSGELYASGNVSGNGVDADADSSHARFPIPTEYQVTTQSACEAAAIILENAGSMYLRSNEQAWLDDATELPGCT